MGSTNTLERRLQARTMACGFCQTGAHSKCPGGVRNGVNAPEKIITCKCTDPSHVDRSPYCLTCKKRGGSDTIDQSLWTCIDKAACAARVEDRLASDPLIQQIRTQEEVRKMSEATETKTRTPKTPKVGKCLVTGEPTKGGLFKPGMDARYVSIAVSNVMEEKETAEEARGRIAKETNSEPLLRKFERSLELAIERLEKKEAAAKAKADAKAAKAKAPAEAEVEADEDEEPEEAPAPKATKARGKARGKRS